VADETSSQGSESPDSGGVEGRSATVAPVAGPGAADPADLVEPEDSLPEVKLEELPSELQAAVGRARWTELMPVQAKAIPYALSGRDLMIQSRTGSGKTGAFLLPMLERLDPEDRRCQALVLTPTRELAKQVAGDAELLFGPEGIEATAVYGGVAYGPQLDAFRRGVPLVVGTPGRVLDHLLKKNLDLEGLRVLVFDEADRMLSMGFLPDMRRLKKFLPSREFSGYMYSATFPRVIQRLAREFLDEPGFLSLSRDRVHVAETDHVYYEVPGMGRERSLVRVIEVENPHSAIIFCNTKAEVRFLSIVLRRFGYDADEISSDLSQEDREEVMGRIRAGELRFLVATDVAARGIDITELSHVFQYSPPNDPEAYIHRVGRTGRAGAAGRAITLVSGADILEIKRLAKRFKIEMRKRELPSREEVAEVVSERLIVQLEARLRDRDQLERERLRRFIPMVRDLGEDDEEVELIAMLLDDCYRESLLGPPGGAIEEDD